MSLVDEFAGDRDAGRDGPAGLVAGHRRPGGHVGRARGDPPVPEIGVGVERCADTHVHHGHARADLPGEGVDDRSARQEVRHHLRRDLLRPRRDALGVDAVVAREDRDGRGLRQRRRALPGDAREGDGEVLDAAERAAGLGHAVEPVLGRGPGLGTDGADGRNRLDDDLGGIGHPPSRPRASAGGQGDLRLHVRGHSGHPGGHARRRELVSHV